MKYKGEILVNKKVVYNIITNATHPSQIARKLAQFMSKNHPNVELFILYICNEQGEIWIYGVKKKDGKYVVKQININTPLLNRDEINYIFSGNANIGEMR